MVIASVGAHALPVVTGAYVRDTREIIGHFASLDDEAVAEQARGGRRRPVQAIKVGFVGSPRTSAPSPRSRPTTPTCR
jgi:hydroxymethylpyrimidine/phosphomethylpyrimidine kinase